MHVVGLASGAQLLAAGDYQTCAVVNGVAQCWGDDSYGELGNGNTTNSSAPVLVVPWAP